MKSTGIQKILNPVRGDVWYVSDESNHHFTELRYISPVVREKNLFNMYCNPDLTARGSQRDMRGLLEIYSPQIPREEAALLKLLQILSIFSSRDATSEVYSTLIELDI